MASALTATGATVEVIHNEPDGVNINVGSGATAPASLAAAVRDRGADVGFALDGDADRLIAVDADGRIVDGDQVLGILALDRLERGALPEGSLGGKNLLEPEEHADDRVSVTMVNP